MTFVLILLAVVLLAFLLSEPWRRDPEPELLPARPWPCHAVGLWYALLYQDRQLARQRWEWDADDDLP